MQAYRRIARRQTAYPAGLRRVPKNRRCVGSLAALPDVRSRRLLRLLAEQARNAALSRDAPPRDTVLSARGALALVLCRPAIGAVTVRGASRPESRRDSRRLAKRVKKPSRRAPAIPLALRCSVPTAIGESRPHR